MSLRTQLPLGNSHDPGVVDEDSKRTLPASHKRTDRAQVCQVELPDMDMWIASGLSAICSYVFTGSDAANGECHLSAGLCQSTGRFYSNPACAPCDNRSFSV